MESVQRRVRLADHATPSVVADGPESGPYEESLSVGVSLISRWTDRATRGGAIAMLSRPIHRATLTFLLASLALLPARAQRGPRRGEKYALLVGVRRYDPNELRSLQYSEPDVVELAGVLKAEGYQPSNVVLM